MASETGSEQTGERRSVGWNASSKIRSTRFGLTGPTEEVAMNDMLICYI